MAAKPIAHKTAVENIEAVTKRVQRFKTIFSQVQEDWSTKLLGSVLNSLCFWWNLDFKTLSQRLSMSKVYT